VKGGTGTAIVDNGCCSQKPKTLLAEIDLRFITHARMNTKNGNANEEKQLLRRRNLAQRVIGKLELHIGDNFFRFLAWGTVLATIAIGMRVVNLFRIRTL
jgi:hypothetical protein